MAHQSNSNSRKGGSHALFIHKIETPAHRGHNSQWDRPLQLKESPSMPDLKLNWASTESKCQSGGWLSWHIDLLSESSTIELPEEPTHVEERGRVKFPIKEAEFQLWIHLDHLLQSRICQIQSIWCQWDWFQSNWLRIHWSRILDLLHYSSIYYLK